MKECPFCGEKIKAEAIKCRFCGEDLLLEFQPSKRNRIIKFALIPISLCLLLYFLLPILINTVGELQSDARNNYQRPDSENYECLQQCYSLFPEATENYYVGEKRVTKKTREDVDYLIKIIEAIKDEEQKFYILNQINQIVLNDKYADYRQAYDNCQFECRK